MEELERVRFIPKTKKNVRFKAVKCKINSVLKKKYKGSFLGVLNHVVKSFSHLAHEVTIMANGVMGLLVLENSYYPLPEINRKFYEECIKGIKGRESHYPLINYFVETEWKGGFDHSVDTKGYSVPIQTLAERLRINAETHLWYHFFQREFQALKVQTQSKSQDLKLQKIINDPSKPLDTNEQDHHNCFCSFLVFYFSIFLFFNC